MKGEFKVRFGKHEHIIQNQEFIYGVNSHSIKLGDVRNAIGCEGRGTQGVELKNTARLNID